MAASRAIIASIAFLLALPSRPASALGEPPTNIARTSPSLSTSAAAPASRFPPGCAVAITGGRNASRWSLPRASFVVTNQYPHRVTVRMEARAGTDMTGMYLGALERGETRTFHNVLPAGRSIVLAQRVESGETIRRQPIYIWNHGASTCARRFIWVLR